MNTIEKRELKSSLSILFYQILINFIAMEKIFTGKLLFFHKISKFSIKVSLFFALFKNKFYNIIIK